MLERLLLDVRNFVREELGPLEPRFLVEPFASLEPRLEDVRREVRARGWWAPYLPRELGGMGLGLVDYARVAEELGRSPLGHYAFHCQAPDVGNLELLHLHGTPEQQSRWLLPLARGELRSCFSMTEPDFPGSNPIWMGTRAVRHGDDYVIDGKKWFTSAADGAAFAIVMAVTDPDAEPHRRASMFLVPTDAPGFHVLRNVSVMGHAGSGHHSHAEVVYAGVRVPAASRLGAEGDGFRLAQERLGPGRIHHTMRWIGIAERAFELMVARARARRLAPDRTLAGSEIVRAWVAESRAESDAARLLVLDTARLIDEAGPKAARDRISLIKFHTAKVMEAVLDRAIQVHGALGVTDDTPLAFWYRSERAARIYDGPDETHKLAVGRRILEGRGLREER